MSHRALIAERQPNDRFNVYYSQNGAEDIQLLDELRDSLNVHGRVDFESLTGQTIPQACPQIPTGPDSNYTVARNATRIVDPKPVAVNICQKELLLAKKHLSIEVLYVVDDGRVEAYWLAWTYPDVIRPWDEHIEMDVFDAGDVPTSAGDFTTFLNEGEPIRTISDFEQGWLADETVREVVESYHRWMYETQSMTVEEPDERGATDEDPLCFSISTPEYLLVFRVDTSNSLVPGTHPFIVPIQLDSPDHCARIQETARHARFTIGAGLNAAEQVDAEDLHQAYTDALVAIAESHIGDVAPEFIPGTLGEILAEYQQTRDGQTLDRFLRN